MKKAPLTLFIVTLLSCNTLNKQSIRLNMPPGQSKGAASLAVMPFNLQYYHGKKFSGAVVADLFASEFLRQGFQMADRHQLQKVLKEQGLQQSGAFDEGSLAEAGRLLGVEAMVFGSVSGEGENYLLTAKCISVEKGTLLWSLSADYANPRAIVSKISHHWPAR